MNIIYRSYIFCATLLLSFQLNSQTSDIYVYTGATETWVVPAGVFSIDLDISGGAGAQAIDRVMTNGEGGGGGNATGTLAVTPGQTLYINVGGAGGTDGSGGFNGGGNGGFGTAGGSCSGGNAGGGGGASDIRINGNTLSDRIIVAGGGGGGARDYCNGVCQPCGCGGGAGGGGGLMGGDGFAAYNCGEGYPGNGINFGMGASQTAGGMGGPPDAGGINMGSSGVLGIGGNGTDGLYDVAGGGGGGGYYGGGGGGGADDGSGVGAGGGGGGSSYLDPSLTNSSTQSNIRAGNGEIVISYTQPAQVPTLGQWGLISLCLIIFIFSVVMGKEKYFQAT
ncbi:glycine-rich protein [Portibacter lacus]|uniref:receptor protein-tyrosine kinase n=1 Tax=Portibacter lacus TaxID=1099794 RepID=A0AA37SKL2_9BACT|nr:glycine-rich protein [Portibacter lacus]GLR15640.1 hypothetical protein GCM10007940_02550 [Portibacter lacus]